MKVDYYSSFLFFVLLLSGCSQHTEVEASFLAITGKQPTASSDENPILSKMSQRSIDYFTSLAEIINTGEAEDAEWLGNDYDVPLSTLEMYFMLNRGTADTTDAKFAALDVLTMFRLFQKGIFRSSLTHPINIHEAAELKGTEALLPVTVPIGDGKSSILSRYRFVQEEQAWKLDFISTLGINEKVLLQNRKRSSLSAPDFIKSLLERDNDGLNFKYRQ